MGTGAASFASPTNTTIGVVAITNSAGPTMQITLTLGFEPGTNKQNEVFTWTGTGKQDNLIVGTHRINPSDQVQAIQVFTQYDLLDGNGMQWSLSSYNNFSYDGLQGSLMMGNIAPPPPESPLYQSPLYTNMIVYIYWQTGY